MASPACRRKRRESQTQSPRRLSRASTRSWSKNLVSHPICAAPLALLNGRSLLMRVRCFGGHAWTSLKPSSANRRAIDSIISRVLLSPARSSHRQRGIARVEGCANRALQHAFITGGKTERHKSLHNTNLGSDPADRRQLSHSQAHVRRPHLGRLVNVSLGHARRLLIA